MAFTAHDMALVERQTQYEAYRAAVGWREIAVEGIHALAAMRRRMQALEAQCAALRGELRNERLDEGDGYEA